MTNKFTQIKFKKYKKNNIVSFIVPVHNDVQGLEQTLNSIRLQKSKFYNVEIIVASDGAFPEIKTLCKKYGTKLVEITPNSGSYYARNRAIEYSRGNFISLIDADMQLPRGWLKTAIKKLASNYYLAGEIDIDKNRVHTLAEEISEQDEFPIKKHIEEYHFGGAGNLLLKRNLLIKIGGFDQRLRSGGDMEFGNRVYNAGYKLIYLNKPRLIHPPRSFTNTLRKIIRITRGYKLRQKLYPNLFPKPNLRRRLFTLKKLLSKKSEFRDNSSKHVKNSFRGTMKSIISFSITVYKILADLLTKPAKIVEQDLSRKITFSDFSKR